MGNLCCDPQSPGDDGPRRSEGKATKRSVDENQWTQPVVLRMPKADVLREKYEYCLKIGEGTHGTVYRGTDKVTGEEHAIKSVPKGSMCNIEEERTALKAMNHPNTVRFFTAFEDRDNVYFVMELCRGGDLYDHILTGVRFTEAQSSNLMSQMLQAIRYVHGHNIAHRDIKPENFMFAESLESSPVDRCCLKLIDFGICRPCPPGSMLMSKVGTPYYVAPQVLFGSYDLGCDVWSVGVCMYLILSGRLPFTGEGFKDITTQVKIGHWSFEGETWPQVSDSAKDLLRSLMQRNPVLRFTAEKALGHKWFNRLPVPAGSLPRVAAPPVTSFVVRSPHAAAGRPGTAQGSRRALSESTAATPMAAFGDSWNRKLASQLVVRSSRRRLHGLPLQVVKVSARQLVPVAHGALLHQAMVASTGFFTNLPTFWAPQEAGSPAAQPANGVGDKVSARKPAACRPASPPPTAAAARGREGEPDRPTSPAPASPIGSPASKWRAVAAGAASGWRAGSPPPTTRALVRVASPRSPRPAGLAACQGQAGHSPLQLLLRAVSQEGSPVAAALSPGGGDGWASPKLGWLPFSPQTTGTPMSTNRSRFVSCGSTASARSTDWSPLLSPENTEVVARQLLSARSPEHGDWAAQWCGHLAGSPPWIPDGSVWRHVDREAPKAPETF